MLIATTQWIFTFHDASSMNFYCLMINNGLKHTIYQISAETANRIQSEFFCIKLTSMYLENVHHRPRRKVIVVCGKSSQICCSACFSSGMVLGLEWSLWNVTWSIAPHIHDSQVVCNIRSRSGEFGGHSFVLRDKVGMYSEKWKLTEWLRLRWHTFVRFRDNWIKFCSLP